MVEWPQTNARMAPATQSVYEMVVDGVLEWCLPADASDAVRANPELDPFYRHLAAAVPVSVRDQAGQRLAKGKTKRQIDLAIALVMEVGLAMSQEEPEEQHLFVFDYEENGEPYNGDNA